MFNSFLPILLESRIDSSSSKGGRSEALEELLLYSLGGCPGAIVRSRLSIFSSLSLVRSHSDSSPLLTPFPSLHRSSGFQIGAYLIQTPHLNRRSTLSIFTVLTALSTLAFAAVSSKGGVIVSSMAISLAGSVMYSVLYAMTPEVSRFLGSFASVGERRGDEPKLTRRSSLSLSFSIRSSPPKSEGQQQELLLLSVDCMSTFSPFFSFPSIRSHLHVQQTHSLSFLFVSLLLSQNGNLRPPPNRLPPLPLPFLPPLHECRSLPRRCCCDHLAAVRASGGRGERRKGGAAG